MSRYIGKINLIGEFCINLELFEPFQNLVSALKYLLTLKPRQCTFKFLAQILPVNLWCKTLTFVSALTRVLH